MALPSNPVRKSGNVETDAQGRVRPGSNQYAPTRRTAGPVGREELKHPTAPISPDTVPINDKDAGSYRVKGANSGGVNTWMGVD